MLLGHAEIVPQFVDKRLADLVADFRLARTHNVLNRQILPALRRCKICSKAESQHAEANHDFKLNETFPKWRGWHAARRGLGSNLYALGVPEKVIQQILRHANVSTTATYYIKTVPAQVTDAMEKLEQVLPESLSGNDVTTAPMNTSAAPAVNWEFRLCSG